MTPNFTMPEREKREAEIKRQDEIIRKQRLNANAKQAQRSFVNSNFHVR